MPMYSFWKITPGGNSTVLVNAADVPPSRRAQAAAEIMNPLHLGGEQVGFVRLAAPTAALLPRLDMMGGEFCLNATRAFAALLARRGLLTPQSCGKSAELTGQVEVSGADTPVAVRVIPDPDLVASREAMSETCHTAACLCLAPPPRPEVMARNLTLVRVPGIAHLVLENTVMPSPANLAETCATLRARYHLEHEEAVGCLWLGMDAGMPSMQPAVWVRETRSLCQESACGSGTLACALLLAERTGKRHFSIRQPSGVCLSVDLETASDGALRAWVGGPTRFVAEGALSLG